MGFGGVAAAARATGLAESTIRRGVAELADLERLAPPEGKQRRAGSGRKAVEERNPEVIPALLGLLEPATRGDPESPLLWTSKSSAKLARELAAQGFAMSPNTVLRLMRAQGFTSQKTRKTLEGSSHEDRDAQFEYIAKQTRRFQEMGQPVISVDTKKKELVGEYANGGQEWHPKGGAPRVLTYDFPNGKPKAVPYCPVPRFSPSHVPG